MTVEKIIGIKQVSEQVGLSRAMIYLLCDPRSRYYCEAFPKPVSIGQRRIGWIQNEINAWVISRIEQRDGSKALKAINETILTKK